MEQESGSGEPNVKIERFARTLRVELTPEEVARRADRCAHVVAEREGKVEEAKTATAHIKARIKELDAELRSLSNEVRDKAKYTEVDCERRYNYRLGTIAVVRLDTNATVDERAMTGAERQLENGLKDSAAKNAEEKAPDLATRKGRGRKKGSNSEASS
jgi:hypothetical protein